MTTYDFFYYIFIIIFFIIIRKTVLELVRHTKHLMFIRHNRLNQANTADLDITFLTFSP